MTKPAPAHFPYTEKDGHRTMAEVLEQEARVREYDRARYARERVKP